MKKFLPLVLALVFYSLLANAQTLDSLRLSKSDIPAEYTESDKLLCKSVQAATFYESPEMYAMLLGNVVEKSYQSFENKDDKGSVLLFVFDEDISDNAFIPGLLWGNAGKPTKSHPEEYLAKGNMLIIWSFDRKSPIKDISKEKIVKNL